MGLYTHKKSFPKALFSKQTYLLPAGYLLLSVILMLLPLEGVVTSFKAVLAYVFLPQIRAAHTTVTYADGVFTTVRELVDAHAENQQLKQTLEMNKLLVAQAQTVLEENARLSGLLKLEKTRRWCGVWAKVAYREPNQWNTVTIDKGSKDHIALRSAVISMENGQEGLAGVVVEVTESTAKVMLLRDEDFSASVYLEKGKEEGVLVGDGPRPLRVDYLPLQTPVEAGDYIFTSASSPVFPAGILVGKVSKVKEDSSLQTSLTVYVEPQVRPAAIKEVFVISREGKGCAY